MKGTSARRIGIVPILVAATTLPACDRGPKGASRSEPGVNAGGSSATVPSGSASAAGSPSPAASTNPTPPKPYEGPTGAVIGTVRISGDPPPDTPHAYPKGCAGEAGSMYGKLFRVGREGALADAIVAVTQYEGFVPPKQSAVRLTIRGCAYSTRSIAMTDGQHLEVRNVDTDTTSYLPWLDGAKLPAGIIAVPQGEPVRLYSRGYGRYWLRDQMSRPFMVAHVFHLRFSTTAVTGLDGVFRIEGVPVGKVEVSAMLPQANLLSVSRPLEVKEGDNRLDLELVFDRKRDVPAVPEETLPDEARNKVGSPPAP